MDLISFPESMKSVSKSLYYYTLYLKYSLSCSSCMKALIHPLRLNLRLFTNSNLKCIEKFKNKQLILCDSQNVTVFYRKRRGIYNHT